MVHPSSVEVEARIQPVGMPGFRDVTQIAVITRDTKTDAQNMAEALGVGAFKCAKITPPALFNVQYDGLGGDGSMLAAVTFVGDIQLEVIQPLANRNVYDDYLKDSGDVAGVEHIFLQHEGINYHQAMAVFEKAGYAPKQHAQLNVAGRLGVLPVPPLPGFLAPSLATRFCYTSTHASLKTDIELAQFAFGVPQRLGLRMMIPDEWIPGGKGEHFESLPPDGPLRKIDAAYVLGLDMTALAGAYEPLTGEEIRARSYNDDVLPGQGEVAEIRLSNTSIFLVAPSDGPLRSLLEEKSEGIRLLRGRPGRGGGLPGLKQRGWTLAPSDRGLLATHASVPFALWVTDHVE